ncbi:chondroitinase family polysaccharide lyase [Proteiniphilum sp. X52]|uniref:chondroitinase family polysaccharide lyase n=1 Tax=Proteiniphilum sp. X52 TaxID=2382159 RepID=UPI000F0A4872|nr:chondroitinase family polysaccharide lyase [Proteiniphilum sp. X52]RNC66402.1 sugar lyase [Proteiniphilum sp. X52]
MRRYFLSWALSCIVLCMVSAQDYKEYNHESIFSFEQMTGNVFNSKKSSLAVVDDHFKHLKHSLKWEWKSAGAKWGIKQDIGYKHPKKADDAYISSFVFWIYAKEPITEKKLKVEFLKQGTVQCWFDYGLDFTGWRGAWIAFDRDMQGKPQEGMDEVRFSVPGQPAGTLYFDHLILSSMQDARHHTADFQAPFINRATSNHWLVLHESWMKKFDLPLTDASPLEINDIREIENRVKDYLLKGRKAKPVHELENQVRQYQITENPDKTLKGVPLFFERFGETYQAFGAEKYSGIYNNILGISQFNTTLLNLSVAYNLSDDESEKRAMEKMFVKMIRHMLDQGFQAGSAMGTLHHLGYSMRDYYPAIFLMSEVLDRHRLKNQLQQAMEWFAGTGEVKTAPLTPGMDVDTFNTNLIARLTSILMIDSIPDKVRYMQAFSRWLDNGYQYADGTRGTFKIDGTMFHHRHNYPAYAVGGLDGAVAAVYLLRNTPFRISEQSHRILKKALLAMRTYCNLQTWPLSLSGRHPDGEGSLNPEHFALLALAGTPDGKNDIDKEMAEAYLRLVTRNTDHALLFLSKGFTPEKSPAGNRTFNYSGLNVHRRDDWMVSAMGHSRYLWASEGYRGENLYGRYLNHGSLQILATGDPVSNQGSGFRQEGWDWNHFPGTTATVLPMEQLKADVKNVDNQSGFEEMLLSDESFCGGISISHQNGAFGMKLHEHDKYNGSLRARKSVFFFDNRVVALGSNIESALPEETHTTLFQVYLGNEKMPFHLNGEMQNKFPFQCVLKGGHNLLSDGLGNYFHVPKGEVIFKKELQHSLHEETGAPTQNNFALAAINHGPAPANGSYEYMVLVQPSQEEKENIHREGSAAGAFYKVLQQDSLAHIVRDRETRTTGYVLFEAGAISADELLRKVNLPALVMIREIDPDKLILSACDPDLRFYEGASDEVYDADGKRAERSVYSREWIDNPAGISYLNVTLDGSWEMGLANPHARIVESGNDHTLVEFECRHGLSQEVLLIRK